MKTIKLVATAIVFCLSLNASSQNNLNGKVDFKDVKIEDFSIKVEVDSLEDLESTFKAEDFEDILSDIKFGEDITFELKCNGDLMENGRKSSMSYTITGNSKEKEKFIEGISKIRSSAIKYYKSKK